MAAKADTSNGGGETMEKLLDSLDKLHVRMDSMELGEGSKNPLKSDAKKDDDDDKRKDEEEEEDKKKDSRKDEEEEEEEKKDSKKDARKDQIPPQGGTGATPPPVVADKKRKDAKRGDDDDDKRKDARGRGDDDDDRKDSKRGDDDDDDDDRKDSRADSVEELRRMLKDQAAVIQRLEGRMRPVSDEEHYQFAEAQAKADSVFQGFGERAPRPLEGESLIRYRKRLATHLKKHSTAWKGVKFSELSEPAFAVAETQVYADAIDAAAHPVDLQPGEMRPVETQTSSGHRMTVFHGKDSFVKGMAQNRRVTQFARPDGSLV